ncbi:helix-turn-helix domain-containing protein [Nocardioides jejuensis]|uniref:AraC family transcriptional regulator n=1 Tax=Nocardioides jejuensis TaxID=2502782 RepID=A0A4R1CFI0_9ACTN|nr:AraC family transcriptional regulator [Nocardioides jejuensis]TCJ29859.1 AraC family transcriptional regulator [Nocardioides jejuensis]
MRHTPIAAVGYHPPEGKAGEVEATTVASMLERGGPDGFVDVQRPEFHFLLLPTSGRGTHMLDFADHPLEPGSVLWVRPGQVQRWGNVTAYDGWVLIYPADLLDPVTAELVQASSPAAPCWWAPSDAAAAGVPALVEEIAELADDDTVPRELRGPALTHLLSAMLLRLTAQASTRPGAPSGSEPWLAFRELLESEHMRHHDVAWYAARLGWSPRTLARATKAATGRSPKELIDERVLLEARRLLAHSELSVARVGETIGFDDASNFGAWFRLRAGQTPAAFRTEAR